MKEPKKTFPLRLPPSIRRKVDELAEREGLSLNRFILWAITEKMMRLEMFEKSRELIDDQPRSLLESTTEVQNRLRRRIPD